MKNTTDKGQGLTELDFLSSISKSDLKELGLGDVGYVKRYIVSGQPAFVLHAADGTAIAAQKSGAAAEQTAYQHDLELVAVH